jgi:anti-anti-sigma regulatory factor
MSVDRTVLLFPEVAGARHRRTLRGALLKALRSSESPVIVDLSARTTLNPEDIELLLDCLALRAGRDTQVVFVAVSPVIRTLLDVTRISLLVPVFDSLEAALRYPPVTANDGFENQFRNPCETSILLIGVHE